MNGNTYQFEIFSKIYFKYFLRIIIRKKKQLNNILLIDNCSIATHKHEYEIWKKIYKLYVRTSIRQNLN